MNKQLKHLLSWRALLAYSHRWLGIAGCVLFVAWFFSGIVMMYARMPELAPEEKLARAPALDLSAITVTPAAAAERAGARGTAMQVAMYGDRPIYRFGASRGAGAPFVFADTGDVFAGITLDEARAIARRYEPQHDGPLRHDAYLTEPDQWTLQARAALPMHRFALDDAAGTHLYVSETTGDVVLRTTRTERIWGYLGPVIHWVYFTPLRRNASLWTEVVVWSSLIGCVMCITGLVWGLLRFSPSARFRLKRQHAHSPYAGLMKWHHYAGLLFGVIALTWTYSGLLSMSPFDWFRPVGARAQPLDSPARPTLDEVSIDGIRAAFEALSAEFAPRVMELVEVQGRLYWAAQHSPAPGNADAWRSPSLFPRRARPTLEHRYVSVASPQDGAFAAFPRESMFDVARATMPGVAVRDAVWLTEHDGYYYDPTGTRPLPVLRVRYDDAQETWLYLDPARGGVVQRSEEITRLRRWLYQGLHSLDFPFLYARRPLWDVVVIVLSLGGLVLSATTLKPAWVRLAARARRLFRIAPRRRRPFVPALSVSPESAHPDQG